MARLKLIAETSRQRLAFRWLCRLSVSRIALWALPYGPGYSGLRYRSIRAWPDRFAPCTFLTRSGIRLRCTRATAKQILADSSLGWAFLFVSRTHQPPDRPAEKLAEAGAAQFLISTRRGVSCAGGGLKVSLPIGSFVVDVTAVSFPADGASSLRWSTKPRVNYPMPIIPSFSVQGECCIIGTAAP